MNNKIKHLKYYILFFLVLSLLSACSGESFHLRGNYTLPKIHQKIYISGLAQRNRFKLVLIKILEQANAKVVNYKDKTTTVIKIDNLQEEKKVVAYSSERRVRAYDLALKLDYIIKAPTKNKDILNKKSIYVIQTQLYDSNFTLGKAEEEKEIKEKLRKKAARSILLHLYR